MPETLHVYYGDLTRWNQPLLERVQKAVGRECVGFDGLQADFKFDTRDEALEALLLVRALGVRAETAGIGEGPSSDAVVEAKATMRRCYTSHKG